MAHKTPHRKVTIEMPIEDWRRLELHASAQKQPKNAVLLGWLSPMLGLLKANPSRIEMAD